MAKTSNIITGVALGGAAALGASTAYALRHKITDEAKALPLLGDDYLNPQREPVLDGGGACIEIDAPAELVWQHIKQMGQDRAGWYSFELLERLFTFDIHNHYCVHPEWQNREPGQFLFYHQPPLGIGSDVIAVDDEKHQMASVSDSRTKPTVQGSEHLVPPFGVDYFCWTWNFGVFERPDGGSLYVTKAQVSFTPFTPARKLAVATVLGFPSYFMLSRQCDVLKAVSENRQSIDINHI